MASLFMVSACTFGILLEHPESPARRAIDSSLLRRALMGIAMGATAVTLIYSRWGRRSGAHFNPATTLAFLRMNGIHGI
jgi:aquaporin Z